MNPDELPEGQTPMSETPDSERPRDEGGDEHPIRPPYPGWSAQQPPRSGWAAPGQQPPPPGSQSGQQSGWTSTGPQPDQGQGWGAAQGMPPGGQPGAPGSTSPAPGPPAGGWGGGPNWSWQVPTVKPGVIPLRPLGVGEILDGAVTTIRRNPGPMLGLSAIVAIIVQLIGLVAAWAIFRNIETLDALPATATADEVIGAAAGIFGSASIVVAVDWIATVILTGILTVVVSRAVLGHNLTVSEAWSMAKRRLPKLLLLTLVYALIWIAPLVAASALIVLLIVVDAGALGVLVGLGAVVAAIWLYVRYALATPAFMLESAPAGQPGAQPRPIGIATAFRRSAQLVRTSWWRVFGILILVWLVAAIVAQVVALLFSIPFAVTGDPFDPATATSLGMLTLSALGGIVATTITAPFLAAAVALLYVDRRIRSEALDIELARAAGVTIPGRTDQPPPGR